MTGIPSVIPRHRRQATARPFVRGIHPQPSRTPTKPRPQKPGCPMKDVGHDEGASFRTSCMRNPSGRVQDEDGCPMKDVGHDGGARINKPGCPMKDVGHDGGGGGGAVTGNTVLCFLS